MNLEDEMYRVMAALSAGDPHGFSDRRMVYRRSFSKYA